MADIDVTIVTGIEGLPELEEAFTSGSKRAVRKFLRNVEMKAAKVLQDEAEATAPFDTGKLSESIARQTVQADGALTVRVGPSKDAFYGMFQEFGAPEAGIPAQHWLENAAKSVQDEVLNRYYEALNEGLADLKG